MFTEKELEAIRRMIDYFDDPRLRDHTLLSEEEFKVLESKVRSR